MWLAKIKSQQANGLFDYAEKVLSKAKIPFSPVAVSENKVFDKILKGRVNTAILPLHRIPLSLPDGIIIAALSERLNPAGCLVIGANVFDAKQMLCVKKNATAFCEGPLHEMQLRDFRPDLELVKAEEMEDSSMESEADVLIQEMAMLELNPEEASAQHIFPLNPKEFIPYPGQGVFAFIAAAKDKPTRRLLKKIHHREVAQATNVERSIGKLFSEEEGIVGAYCEVDDNSYFHVHAVKVNTEAKTAQYVQESSSTPLNLADRVAEKLK